MKRRIPIVLCFFAAAIVFAEGAATARIMRAWTYADLSKNASIVVIAKPIATRKRNKQAKLPNIQSVNAAGKTTAVFGLEVETTFTVSVVLQGNLRTNSGARSKTFVLRHYRPKATGPVINGPGLVSFNPKARTQFLMFLVRQSDGRYVAVSGQTDPDQAIEPVRHGGP